MITRIYKQIKKVMPVKFKSMLVKVFKAAYEGLRTELDEFANVAYSQEGEDRILYSIFGDKKSGFYIDVGAYHPKRFSNTYIFYLRGWRGINIDANPQSMPLFEKTRPRDINVTMGVGERAGKVPFFVFNEPAFDTFDEKIAKNVAYNKYSEILKTQIIQVMPLFEVLDKHIPKEVNEIDFMSVDVEGKDLEVLKSNDWLRYKPSWILVECYGEFTQKEGFSLEEVINNEFTQYLRSKGYEVFAKTLKTLFFKFKRYQIEIKLKVFCYDLPMEYQSVQGELPLPSETFYSIYDFFRNSIGTTDPSNADYFFVPLNLIQFQFRNEDPKKVLKELKYFTGKKNHIIVATGDFSQRSKKNHFSHAYKKTYDWLEPFMLLALESTSDLMPDQDIGIIPFNTLVNIPYFNTNKRTYLYSFLGELNPKFLPKNHVRHQLNYLEKKPDVLIASKLDNNLREVLKKRCGYEVKDDYELVARNSIFALAPADCGKWTYKFFHAIQWGSIPVLFSDDYIKPFSDSIPYDSFSLTLPEKDILDVDRILRNIPLEEIKRYQANLKANQARFTKRSFLEELVRALEKLSNAKACQ